MTTQAFPVGTPTKHLPPAFMDLALRKKRQQLIERQTPEREKFRADFILCAIGTGGLPPSLEEILLRATEAETYVFGGLEETA